MSWDFLCIGDYQLWFTDVNKSNSGSGIGRTCFKHEHVKASEVWSNSPRLHLDLLIFFGRGCWVVHSEWMGQWFNQGVFNESTLIRNSRRNCQVLKSNFPKWNNFNFGAYAVKKIFVSIVFISLPVIGPNKVCPFLRFTNLEIRYVLNWSQVEEETTRNQWFCIISRLRRCEKSPFVDMCALRP